VTGGIAVRAARPGDRAWIDPFLASVNATQVARRGELMTPTDHPMLIAEMAGEPIGLATYIVNGALCELLTLHAVTPWAGAGSALLAAIADVARATGCRRLWLVTTNDNVDALRFYQRRGFRIVAVHPGAVDDARRTLKPGIPEIGEHGIPLGDEIVMERDLDLPSRSDRPAAPNSGRRRRG
jgi:N-acetylglutamate synthase-like GNAT family acetyltransferase